MLRDVLHYDDLRLAVRPHLQIATGVLVSLGLLGGWTKDRWVVVLGILILMGVSILWIRRQVRQPGPHLWYIYISAVINLVATSAIVGLTGGAYSPFWLLFLIGAVASAMSFRGQTGLWLERWNAILAASVMLAPALITYSLTWPTLTLVLMQVGALFMSGHMVRRITASLVESRDALRDGEQRYQTLLTATQRQMQELVLLHKVRTALAREMDLPTFFRVVVEAIVQTFGYTQVSIYRLQGDVLVLQHQVGYERVITTIPITEGISGRVIRTGKPILIDDVQHDPDFLGAIEGVVSEICIPLFDQQQVAGMLNVESTHGLPLTESDLHLMVALGEHVSVALERARFHTQAQQELAERHRTEIALRTTEARYRTLVEHLPAITYLAAFDEAKTRLYISPQIQTLVGVSPAEYLADPQLWQRLLHPADRERVIAESAHFYETLEPFVSEYRFVARDGRVVWFREEAIVIRNEQGVAQFFQGAQFDITERKQWERELETIVTVSTALRRAANRAEMAPIILDQLLLLLDAEGALLDLHDSFTGEIVTYLGRGAWTNATNLHTPAGAGLSGYLIAHPQAYLSQDVRTDPRLARSDLLNDLYSVAGVPLLVQREAIGVLWIGRQTPVTSEEVRLLTTIGEIASNALRRAELLETLEHRIVERTRELAEANVRLQELDRMKDEFVSNVSHELRTPLTNISLHLSLLGKRGAPGLDTALPTLKRETQRLARLIEDVLTLARITRQGTALVTEPVVLDTLIAEVLQTYILRAEAKHLTLLHQPDATAPLVFLARAPMVQVITNLVNNAIAYAAPQTLITIATSNSGELMPETIYMRVHNLGPTIPSEDLAHLFERFYRGQTGHESGEPGTGLGLSICKEIVERHGGQISVRSEADWGTEFEVRLPVAPAIRGD